MEALTTKNHIEISNVSFDNGIISKIGYKDIDEKLMKDIVNSPKLKIIQISKELPIEAYKTIDSMLEKKNSLVFRIYGLYSYEHFDISFLKAMPHLQHLIIDCHLRNTPNLINFDIIKDLHLKSLSLDAFDLIDYSFIQYLNEDIEEITIDADTTKKAIIFDCKWLLKYKRLHSLWLGKKAKKILS